jgi:hypothetical protein
VSLGLTDAGLSNWGNSWHAYYCPVGGMDVLATSTNPNQPLLLAGSYGAGRLVYFGGDPTYHYPVGQSGQLLRQATQWVGTARLGTAVVAVTPSGAVSGPVDHAVVAFSDPIDPDTFTPAQTTFTGPGGPLDVTAVTPVTGSFGRQFTVAFAAQADLGDYTLRIGPGLRDLSGRAVAPFTALFTLAINVLPNGGFETGSFSPEWVTGGGRPTPVISTAQAHSGTYSAFLGTLNSGSEPSGNSFIKQTVTLPAGHPMLSFWYYPNSTDDVFFDWQEAQIQSTSGSVLAQVFKVAEDTQTWTRRTFDLTPFAGQTVVLYFNVHQDGAGDPTGMYLDDVEVLGVPGAPPVVDANASSLGAVAGPGVSQPADGGRRNDLFLEPSRLTAAPAADAVAGQTSVALAQLAPAARPEGQPGVTGRVKRGAGRPAADADDLWTAPSDGRQLL